MTPNDKASIPSSPCPQYNQPSDKSPIPYETSMTTHTPLPKGGCIIDSSSILSSSSCPSLTSQHSILSPHDNPPIDSEQLQEDSNSPSLSNEEQLDDKTQSLPSQSIRMGRTRIPNRKFFGDEWVNNSTTLFPTPTSRTILGYISPHPSLQD
jgi:hypothetical protein